MLKILVTGANGFVGSHIVDELYKNKHHILCPLRKTANLKWISNLPVNFIYGDLNDDSFLKKIIVNIDIIVHCAGSVRAITKNEYFSVNVGITKKICETILKMNYHKLKKIIFISSQAAMGPSISFNSIRKATDIESPISDYGLSKLLAEHEIKKKLYGKIPYTILRPAAIYGPRDSDIFIFFKLINKHLKLVTFTKKMLQLVYVKDVVNSVDDCIQNKKTDNNCYYIANSAMYSWGDVGRIISTSVNLKTIPIVIPDFVFKFIGMTSEFLSLFTKKKK
ncbi:MAG: NAD(P)-dependent oxidoreductase, partial [Endomicrobium sp.]|nr:NAD(P)-dependent oxidoreductase [Endomicrobium sp.]